MLSLSILNYVKRWLLFKRSLSAFYFVWLERLECVVRALVLIVWFRLDPGVSNWNKVVCNLDRVFAELFEETNQIAHPRGSLSSSIALWRVKNGSVWLRFEKNTSEIEPFWFRTNGDITGRSLRAINKGEPPSDSIDELNTSSLILRARNSGSVGSFWDWNIPLVLILYLIYSLMNSNIPLSVVVASSVPLLSSVYPTFYVLCFLVWQKLIWR